MNHSERIEKHFDQRSCSYDETNIQHGPLLSRLLKLYFDLFNDVKESLKFTLLTVTSNSVSSPTIVVIRFSSLDQRGYKRLPCIELSSPNIEQGSGPEKQ